MLKNWLANLDKYDLVKQADRIVDRDILLIGGKQDEAIEIEKHILPLYRKLQELGAESVNLEILDTDHTFSNSRTELYKIISKWIKAG
jgi:dipeptidyl aminopeptidase/acylaminoacyl peptidase